MIDAFVNGDWFSGAMRLVFVAGVYLFLFIVLRSTGRDLASVARGGRAGTAPVEAALIVVDGSGSSLAPGTVIPLADDAVIGRDAGLTVRLDDPRVSALHAELNFLNDQWWLRDLGSSNGTFLNGQPVHSVVAVRSGDVLQCAAVRLRFVTPYLDSADFQVT